MKENTKKDLKRLKIINQSYLFNNTNFFNATISTDNRERNSPLQISDLESNSIFMEFESFDSENNDEGRQSNPFETMLVKLSNVSSQLVDDNIKEKMKESISNETFLSSINNYTDFNVALNINCPLPQWLFDLTFKSSIEKYKSFRALIHPQNISNVLFISEMTYLQLSSDMAQTKIDDSLKIMVRSNKISESEASFFKEAIRVYFPSVYSFFSCKNCHGDCVPKLLDKDYSSLKCLNCKKQFSSENLEEFKIIDLSDSLQLKFLQKDFSFSLLVYSKIRFKKLKDNSFKLVFSDVFDGERLKSSNFGLELLELSWMLVFDWIDILDDPSKTYNIGGLFLSCLALHPDDRFKQKNMILVLIVPGPSEPESLQSFLKSFSIIFQKRFSKINLLTPFFDKKVSVVENKLDLIGGDIPAFAKMIHVYSQSAYSCCKYCWQRQIRIGETKKKGFGYYMRTKDPFLYVHFPKTSQSVINVSEEITRLKGIASHMGIQNISLPSSAPRTGQNGYEKLIKSSGVKGLTWLFRVNEDLFDCLSLDALHNILLGISKTTMKETIHFYSNSINNLRSCKLDLVVPSNNIILFPLPNVDVSFFNYENIPSWNDVGGTERRISSLPLLDGDFDIRRRLSGSNSSYVCCPFSLLENLDGEEVKAYVVFFSPIHMSLLPHSSFRLLFHLLHSISVILLSRTTLLNYAIAHVLILFFLENCSSIFPSETIPINFHHLIHWLTTIFTHGPPSSFWLYGSERSQQKFKKIKTNKKTKEMEMSILNKWYLEDTVLSLVDQLKLSNSSISEETLLQHHLEENNCDFPFVLGNHVQIVKNGLFQFGKIISISEDTELKSLIIECLVFYPLGLDINAYSLILDRNYSKKSKISLPLQNLAEVAFSIFKKIHIRCVPNSSKMFAIGCDLHELFNILDVLIGNNDLERLLNSDLSLHFNPKLKELAKDLLTKHLEKFY